MPLIYGKNLSQEELAKYAGGDTGNIGITSVMLNDGPGKYTQALEIKNAAGLYVRVLTDRCMDIADVEYQGIPLGWHSPAHIQHPALHSEDQDNFGLMKSFAGFLITCGLDHAFGPEKDSLEDFAYPNRLSMHYPLHGRVTFVPAQNVMWGQDWDRETPVLWCEGTIIQATLFAENIRLVRRIEIPIDKCEIKIHDRIENRGFHKTPHMLLYHLNFGYPLLDEGSVLYVPTKNAEYITSKKKVGEAEYAIQKGPAIGFKEQVYLHDLTTDANNNVSCALVNYNLLDQQGLAGVLEFNKNELPYLVEWQNLQMGNYSLGVEPSSSAPFGRKKAHKTGDMRFLEKHGDQYSYTVTIKVLSGREVIDQAVKSIYQCQTPPGSEIIEQHIATKNA